jgi:ABC-type uncharacterized transport system ATPase subunit
MNLDLAKEFIENLIEDRNFLCWQLSNANELISEEMFKEIEDKHFRKYENKSQEQLNSETEELFKLIGGEKMEVTTVAAILKCDYESASKSLINLVDKIEKGLI